MFIPHSQPFINGGELNLLSKVIKSKYIASGKYVKIFEKQLAGFLKTKYAVVVSSGTAALHLALLALKIKTGDEVIIPSYTCSALLNAVLYCNAKPIIADIGDDFNLSFIDLQKKISAKTKAIIFVHSFGQVSDLEKILKFKIPVIEDITHCIGAKYNHKLAGTKGKIAVCSFYATKFITTGEGACFFTNDFKIFNFIQDKKEYDEKKNFSLRYNYKMTDLQAALGIVQLRKIKNIIKKRKQIAKKYFQNLPSPIILPKLFKNKEHTFYRYVILFKQKNKLKKFLNDCNIQAKEPVYKPLHQYLNLNKKHFPYTEYIFNKALSLPIYPALSSTQQSFIIKKVKEFFNQ